MFYRRLTRKHLSSLERLMSKLTRYKSALYLQVCKYLCTICTLFWIMHPNYLVIQKILLLKYQIIIMSFFLPVDHPFPEETVLSLSLVKSGRDSKLFKKGCALKRSKSNADKGIFYFIHISSKNDILF